MSNNLGSLVADIAGTELSPEDREIIAHPLIGGMILFTRNYESRSQLTSLIKAMRNAKNGPLLIMVDQEGGRVQRFKNDFTLIPPMAALGVLFDQEPSLALEKARDIGWLLAMELLAAGMDFSLAPVLDLNKQVSKVIGDRAFHTSSNVVIQLACTFIAGMKEAGMAAVGKHFPGHGSIAPDSHVAMPVDERAFKQIENDDLLPFKALIKNSIPALMAAHIEFPNIDNKPVGFSSVWLNDILRQQLGFKGMVLSDDLNMEGANITSSYADRVALAKDAGCDLALLCNNRQGVIEVLDHLAPTSYLIDESKWTTLQGRFSNNPHSFEQSPRWVKTNEFIFNLSRDRVQL